MADACTGGNGEVLHKLVQHNQPFVRDGDLKRWQGSDNLLSAEIKTELTHHFLNSSKYQNLNGNKNS